MREHLHILARRYPIIIVNQMFELPTQLSSKVLAIANVHGIFLIKQDDEDTDQEISNDECEHPQECTLLSDIEEDDLDNQQEVLHLDQMHHDKIFHNTWVPLRKKWSRANTVVLYTPLPNLRHPAGAIAPSSLKSQKSTINISHDLDIVQVLPLPKAGGDQNAPQPKTCGDHNIPQYHNATFEVAKWFMKAIVFTNTHWPISSNHMYTIVDEAWKLAIKAQNCQRALAGALVGTPSICQLTSGPLLKINLQMRNPVCAYSNFCSFIGLIMILDAKNIHS